MERNSLLFIGAAALLLFALYVGWAYVHGTATGSSGSIYESFFGGWGGLSGASSDSGVFGGKGGGADLTSGMAPRSQNIPVGQAISLLLFVDNIGTANAGNSITSLWFNGATQYLPTPALAPGRRAFLSPSTIRCPSVGTFAIVSIANFNHQVRESNYANNNDSVTVNCTSNSTTTTTTTSTTTTTMSNSSNGSLPDLTINFSVHSLNLTVGQNTTVNVTTKNIGAASAGASASEAIYLTTFDKYPVPPLAPQQSHVHTVSLSCSSSGQIYEVDAYANIYRTVIESNYDNNHDLLTVYCS